MVWHNLWTVRPNDDSFAGYHGLAAFHGWKQIGYKPTAAKNWNFEPTLLRFLRS